MIKKKRTIKKKLTYDEIIEWLEANKISAIFTIPGNEGGRGSHFEATLEKLALLDYIKLIEKRDDVIRSLEAAKWVADTVTEDSELGKLITEDTKDKPQYVG